MISACSTLVDGRETLSPAEIAGIVESSRLARILELDRQIARAKLERECLASQVRAQMNRDGVVRHVIPGVGKATLLEGRPFHQCDGCGAAIGEGKRDPYLKVEAL